VVLVRGKPCVFSRTGERTQARERRARRLPSSAASMEFRKCGNQRPTGRPQSDPDPTGRPQRRRFSAADKARLLAEAGACTERGQIAELLRRERIYSSHLNNWRAQFEREGLAGLAPRRRGPQPQHDEKDRVIERLNRQNAKLEKELRISKALIEMQIKAHEILGIALPRIEDASEDDSSSSSDSAPRRSL